MVEDFWDRAFQRFIRRDLQAHYFVTQTPLSLQIEKEDGLAALTALLFALEALERSEDPVIASRAYRHLQAVAIARLHQHRLDWIRELPPEKAAAA